MAQKHLEFMMKHFSNSKKNREHERGNVMIFIFIAIVLFAALSFAVGNMMRGGSAESITREKAKIITGDIIDYARAIRQTVQALRISGCDETELSFEKSPFDGSDADYVNANSPTDFSCHIYHPQGGGLNYTQAPSEIGSNRDWFVGVNRVGWFNNSENIGTSERDLTALLLNINNTLCDRLNDELNGYNVWESGGTHNDNAEFNGNYSFGSSGINRGNSTTPESGCFCDASGSCTSSSPRYFYYTLLKR